MGLLLRPRRCRKGLIAPEQMQARQGGRLRRQAAGRANGDDACRGSGGNGGGACRGIGAGSALAVHGGQHGGQR